MDLKRAMTMNAILRLWMDIILLVTFQYGGHRSTRLDGSAERFSRLPDEASRYNERSGRSADW
jgi:hypothetical protein